MSTDPPPATTTYGSVTAHLSDTTSVPLITTSTSNPTTSALNNLAMTFLTSRDSLSRLGYGAPVRITTTTSSGQRIFQGYMAPSSEIEANEGGTYVEGTLPPPALVSTVIAPQRRDIGEAMRARDDLERVGRMVQEEWRRDQIGEDEEDERIQQNEQ
ncbi:MAG: hypothetical protein M1830_002550 [Pleopsidium flavum]|nr:MAG: hypothetical protein M1830_002550 [Pleopsidium flavum]